jgi:hypothetical protein
LVAGSAVLGGRLLSSARDTVAVWASAHDLAVGDKVGDGDLVSRSVHFDDAAQREQYLLAAQPLPAGTTIDSPVAAGELIARSAIGNPGALPPQLPLGIAAADAPADLAAGDEVAVWAVPDEGAGKRVTLALGDVTVVTVSGSEALDASSSREVLVELGAHDDAGAALATLAGAHAVLVRVGG